MDTVETYVIDETHRYRVTYDECDYMDSPADWGVFDGVGMRVLFDSDRRSYDYLDRVDATTALVEHWWNAGVDADTIVDRLQRHGMLAVVLRLRNYRTEVPVLAWAPVADNEGVSNDDFKSWFKPLQQWFAGEVYVVSIEEFVTYTANDGRTIAVWELEDAIAGVYFDDGYPTLSEVENVL